MMRKAAAAAACVAAGSYSTTKGIGSNLIESWNGSRWALVPIETGTAGA